MCENEDIMRLLRTKIFTLQCIDYINLCYIVEALYAKNIIQVAHYPYLMIYSWLMDLTLLYVNYAYASQQTQIYPAICVHGLFMVFETLWLFKNLNEKQEEYNLKYLRRFGASTEFNRAKKIREGLMLSLRFCLFSQYVTAVHYLLGVYVEDKIIICLMFIGQLHLGIINISYSIFKRIECKSARICQIVNLIVTFTIRIFQLIIVILTNDFLERINFYSIFIVEIITLIIMIYMSYTDYLNFGIGLVKDDD